MNSSLIYFGQRKMWWEIHVLVHHLPDQDRVYLPINHLATLAGHLATIVDQQTQTD